MPISFFGRIIDLIAPRSCAICGCRLVPGEESICTSCNLHLPRTQFSRNPMENEMAQLFWVQLPIERAAALMFYQPKSEACRFIHRLKYEGHSEIGEQMGRLMAEEMGHDGFFDGIDVIVPVPLTRRRERQRGYNQSLKIAEGLSQVTGIPVAQAVIRRKTFFGSQTQKGRWERQANVEKAFELRHGEQINGKHVLLVDDVVTTGATAIACGQQLMQAGDIKISVLSIGFTKA